MDDLAATSMARLWDVGKTEPIKVGKASPTEGTMPTSIYLILKYFSLYPNAPGKAFAEGVRANAMIGGDNASRSVAVGMVLGMYSIITFDLLRIFNGIFDIIIDNPSLT